MGNQHKTSIPSSSKYVTLLFHKINNTELKSIVVFNAFTYDNGMDYL